MNIAEIQEGPDALLHPSVRDWEPAPFEAAAYEVWASSRPVRSAPAVTVAKAEPPIDPGLRRTPYLDELEMNRPWFRS